MNPMEAWAQVMIEKQPKSTKCAWCKKKPHLLKCKECYSQFCTGCIQMEIHACPNLPARKKELLSNLESKLVKVVAPKISKI